MADKKALAAAVLVFIFTFILGANGFPTRSLAASLPTPTPDRTLNPAIQSTGQPQSGTDEAIQAAFQTTVNQSRLQAVGLLIYEPVIVRIQYSQDGQTALVWVGMRDPQTGEIIAEEPGLSIARNPQKAPSAVASSWSITLQSAGDFNNRLQALPDDLLTPDVRTRFFSQPSSPELSGAAVLTGYKLPWAAGLSKYVTNSIGHVVSVSGGYASCPTTCRYAFDFADGTMFSLLAAKGGTVKAYKTTCANNDHNCTNYLVLEDQSTSPATYQLYYHMAQETIPQRLRTIGAPVAQGEYIGNADNTGNSTGSHLHFHVYKAYAGQTNWSWGTSQDFAFDDVTTNGGRPRTCSEAREKPEYGSECMPNNRYTSGNTPANPPSGTLDLPVNRQMITNRTVWVQGLATDDLEITRIEVMANYDGTWKHVEDISPASPYGKDVDLCSAGIPDGPFTMTVRIFDREGSQASGLPILQLIKSYACGSAVPPTITQDCTPGANQVALYAETDFRGACQTFDLSGNGYTTNLLSPLNDNQAASIQVGSGVRGILYDLNSDVTSSSPTGRIESFDASDAALSDNPIGSHTVSGLWVVSKSSGPDQVQFHAPVGNRLTAGQNPTSIDSLVLTWEGGAGGTAFDVNLTGPTSLTKTVTGATGLSVGTLTAGKYTLTVTAKNSDGTTGHSNQNSTSFTVDAAALPTAAKQSLPYSIDFQTNAGNWVGSGLWRFGSVEAGGQDPSQAWVSNQNNEKYADPLWRAGDLTSPPIQLGSNTAYLRFKYFNQTEDGNTYWDKRIIQIAEVNADGSTGMFKDLKQLSDDKQVDQVWLNSGPISLASYAGKQVRVRFHFDSVDEINNTGMGWAVDDVSINTTGPDTSCADNYNTPATAQAISAGTTVSATICPEGDIDYYKVVGKKGQPILIDIDARTLNPASSLDSQVFLLDADGKSVIAENDDEQYTVLQDSLLPYIFQRDGTYYIKVKAWNFPGIGGAGYTYNITLRKDIPLAPQDVQIRFPTSSLVPPVPFDVKVAATDADGGPVAQVDFFWHGPDWNQLWTKLGTDTDGSNGWSYHIDQKLASIQGSALYVQARSRTGGIKGAVLWDLKPDMDTPITQLNPLPAQINSTVVQLTWSATDYMNDLQNFELQYQEKKDGSPTWGSWVSLQIDGALRGTWFAGTAGSSYNFRLRGLDKTNHVEAFPDQPEATTLMAKTCTPDANEIQGQNQSNALKLNNSQLTPVYNLCSLDQNGAGDGDWLTFNASAGQTMLLMFIPRGGGAAFTVNLYQGGTKLNTWQSIDYGNSISPVWTPPKDGTYVLEIRPLYPNMSGTDMSYQVWYGPGNWQYLPTISR